MNPGFSFTATPPLALYIHIPWCVRKCPYCDFNSHAMRGDIPEQAYVDALVADLEQHLPDVWGRVVESIFIGGGTPSLFSPQAIERLLAAIRARITLKPDAEVTLEANPGTVDRERYAGYRCAGINRLSLGIQSFDDGLLDSIGRIHDGREALSAVAAAQHAGFGNINLDLMFGLPGQTLAQALDDLRTAAGLHPAHISWYELTIEPNTWFHRHPPPQPGDALLWEMQAAGRELLAASGYARYEVSAYALPGSECRHNLNYWQFGDYLGIGAGAHGKLTAASSQAITRVAKTRHPRSYLASAHTTGRIDSVTVLSPADAVLEYAMNALRLDRGFTTAGFTAATGLPATAIALPVRRAVDRGLLQAAGNVIRATEDGQRYLNELLQLWMPEEVADAGTG